MEEYIIYTPVGFAKITGNNDGITSISISNSEENITDIIPEVLEDCVYQLNEYFNGKRQQFQVKLNPKGPEFQKSVWITLQKNPFGRTVSYSQLSKQLNNIKAIRAIATANGKTQF